MIAVGLHILILYYGAQHLVTATFGQRPKWRPKNFLVTDVPETAGASSDTSINFSLGVE